MANKMIAMLLMCTLVVAALQLPAAATAATDADIVEVAEAKFDAKFRSCYRHCEKECIDNGSSQSFCEVKCDEDCGDKEVADKLHLDLN
ncbi:Major pollen allergen Ole e 6, partial [Cucurbita argyrosperma subsp. sororia]